MHMVRKIYKLHFTSPVRFGQDAGKGFQYCFCSDTLFSALYLSQMEENRQDDFLERVKENKLKFSDAFPYNGAQYFVPRPAGIYAKRMLADTDPSVRKLMKKIQYIPLELFDGWLSGKEEPQKMMAKFGTDVERTRVSLREEEPLPYPVEGFQFYQHCGLYVISESADEESQRVMDDAMRSVAATGIGGKKSSGWGHYILEEDCVPAYLENAMNDKTAQHQMLLSTAYPGKNEASVMDNARYVLKRRGGFTDGFNERPKKKRTTWSFASGSTFDTRFNGTVMEVSTTTDHPVWRYAKALMMGVRTP